MPQLFLFSIFRIRSLETFDTGLESGGSLKRSVRMMVREKFRPLLDDAAVLLFV